MTTTGSPDNVYMEFQGPVPGVLKSPSGHQVVFWVQAAGGAGFTRPSQEERDFYAETGKPVPEWQCEYFDFDGLSWPEAALTIEFCFGSTKLRTLCLPAHTGRTAAEVLREVPELARFIEKHGLSPADIPLSFHDALLRAAATAGVIQRGVPANTRLAGKIQQPWWRRAVKFLDRRRAA